MKKIQSVVADFGEGQSLVLTVPTATGAANFDILTELSWYGTPDDPHVLEEHAPKEAWWTARLADEQATAAQWVETVYEPYMSHLRRFAIYALGGQGLRRKEVAQRDVEDMRRRLYTENATQDQRDYWFFQALYGYLVEKYGGKSGKEVADLMARTDSSRYTAEYMSLKEDMWLYQPVEEPVWVEEMDRRKIDLERSVKYLEAAVAAFRSRGYLLRQAAENEKARRNAIGGVVLEDLVAKIVPLLKGQL